MEYYSFMKRNELLTHHTTCVPKNKKYKYLLPYKKMLFYGVPVMVQWLTNPTRNHKVVALVPGLAQWVNDPALP